MKRLLRFPWMLVALSIVASTAILAARRLNVAGSEMATQQVAVVPQPPDWQPFVAEIVRTHPGFPDLVGHYYRSSAGSERYDMKTPDGSVHMVTVVSITTGWQYSCDMNKNRCQRFPIASGARSMRRIPQRRVDTPGLVSTTQEVAGFQVYEYTDHSGVKNLEAPGLNFAQLVKEDPVEGSRRTMFNIRMGEPPPSLFEPPSGAEIADAKPQQH